MQASLTMADDTAVLVVDDDPSSRAALTSLLDKAGHAVRFYSSAEALLAATLPDCRRCLVADVGLGGLRLHARLRQRGQYVPVVYVTGKADVTTSVRAMKSGAIDFLAKPLDSRELLEAIAAALDSDRGRLRDQPVLDDYASLTPRERQVMAAVVCGLMNKQIAWELKISEITVKLHRCSLMRKMNVRSVVDLVLASQTVDRHAA